MILLTTRIQLDASYYYFLNIQHLKTTLLDSHIFTVLKRLLFPFIKKTQLSQKKDNRQRRHQNHVRERRNLSDPVVTLTPMSFIRP